MQTPDTEHTTTEKPTGDIVTVTLDTPIARAGGKQITEVTLRKPLAGALRGVAMGDLVACKYDAVAQVLPRVSTPMLLKQDIENMDPADLFKLGGEVVGFLLTKEQKAFIPQ
jgi:hypothetical protein